MLIEYRGTLLLVSHDRALLNNVVDRTLALEEGGWVDEYAGGGAESVLRAVGC